MALRSSYPALSALALALGGCASSAGDRYVRSAPAAPPVQQGSTFRAPQVMQGSGVESVIGARADALLARFGRARIDMAEGDARKLQFASPGCVLDIYLYPLTSGAAPVATHVEARNRQGGGEAHRAICIAEVESAARD